MQRHLALCIATIRQLTLDVTHSLARQSLNIDGSPLPTRAGSDNTILRCKLCDLMRLLLGCTNTCTQLVDEAKCLRSRCVQPRVLEVDALRTRPKRDDKSLRQHP